jgi:D-xylulose 5-phosphate/D-fructose 6-phosphate phosphoketolase
MAPDGRVMEVLPESLCQGWLEGYLLIGPHGLFNCLGRCARLFPRTLTADQRVTRNGSRRPAPAGVQKDQRYDRAANLMGLAAR